MNTIITYAIRGKFPYIEWLDALDTKTRAIVLARLARVKMGNFGDCKQIKGGNDIWELHIDYGSGYRIYFGKSGINVVILLWGGSKGTQNRDIERAKRYWIEYKESAHD